MLTYLQKEQETDKLRKLKQGHDVIRIVLSHNPDTARKFAHYPFDLQLSGHTHGGQVCIPYPSLTKQNGQWKWKVTKEPALGSLAKSVKRLPPPLQV
jgi:hypothetical protein